MKNFTICRVGGRVSSFYIHTSSFESGALTWSCTTNLRLRRAACGTNYTLRAVKSDECRVARDGKRCDMFGFVSLAT
jgi:hypothetical protein